MLISNVLTFAKHSKLYTCASVNKLHIGNPLRRKLHAFRFANCEEFIETLPNILGSVSALSPSFYAQQALAGGNIPPQLLGSIPRTQTKKSRNMLPYSFTRRCLVVYQLPQNCS